MSATETPAPFVPSAPRYVLDNFGSSDRIAMLVRNRDCGETIQRITRAGKAAGPEFQAWLSGLVQIASTKKRREGCQRNGLISKA
jgi:hypothetical protein